MLVEPDFGGGGLSVTEGHLHGQRLGLAVLGIVRPQDHKDCGDTDVVPTRQVKVAQLAVEHLGDAALVGKVSLQDLPVSGVLDRKVSRWLLGGVLVVLLRKAVGAAGEVGKFACQVAPCRQTLAPGDVTRDDDRGDRCGVVEVNRYGCSSVTD